MMDVLRIIHWLAGLVVLAEALNKLERVDPMACGLSPHDRVVDSLKALAWLLLAFGAGGAVATPLLEACGVIHIPSFLPPIFERPSLNDTAMMLGFAVLIVRTRVKEG